MAYATTLQLAQALGMEVKVPTWDDGSSPSNEDVGASPGADGVVYLDYKNVIAGSYTLYTGGTTSATATTALTETTHFTIDLTSSAVTITTAGHALIGGTNHIFAKYSYVHPDYGYSDAYLSTVLSRAQESVDSACNTKFTDGTASYPTYPAKVKEVQASKGWFNRRYFTRERPVIDVASALNGALTANATSLTLTTGEGVLFPSSGRIVIDTEIISYTGATANTLTGLTRGVDGSTAAAHSSLAEVHTTCVQVSGTTQGTAPTWTTLAWNSDVFVDDLGLIQVYENSITDSDFISTNLHRQQDVNNRFRVSYLYGFDTIDSDIVRLTILLAKRMLTQDNISKSLIAGRNEFNPQMFNADQAEIDGIINEHIQLEMENT